MTISRPNVAFNKGLDTHSAPLTAETKQYRHGYNIGMVIGYVILSDPAGKLFREILIIIPAGCDQLTRQL